ncbi:MAG: KAP family NTPase [Proteobacteria bacterium]|nr:KAP family NTPase [Pseudomonadota bacterium]
MLTNEEMVFGGKEDVLGRGLYGEKLLKIINAMPNERVILLDARWGEGKTVFARMCQKYFIEEGHRTIYYDVFAHDYYEQPLLPFIAEIYQLIDKGKENEEKIKNLAIAALKDISRVVTAGTAINLTDEILKGKGKNNLNDLKKYLTVLPDNMEDKYKNKPIIFIIDELDRCRPTYAIKILEVIKHLFSVPNIVFILVANSEQLCQSIKHEYGNDIDAYNYLQKFIHLRMVLSKQKNKGEIIDNKKYIYYCIKKLEFDTDNDIADTLIIFSDHYRLSFREIERYLLTLKVMLTLLDNPSYEDTYIITIIFIIIVKNKFPTSYVQLANENITFQKFIQETEIEERIEKNTRDHITALGDILRLHFKENLQQNPLKILPRTKHSHLDVSRDINHVINTLNDLFLA